jgi:hypothetical protein
MHYSLIYVHRLVTGFKRKKGSSSKKDEEPWYHLYSWLAHKKQVISLSVTGLPGISYTPAGFRNTVPELPSISLL